MEPVRQVAATDWMSDPDVHAVFAALSAPGDPQPAVLFVGGCVRNLLLGRPANDVDMATVHTPETVIERLEAAGIAHLTIGIDHGTITAHFGPKLFEITTLRIDVETFGRHARVAFTDDWAADASRRDFTINALYADTEGCIYDPLGGIDDVAAGRVRFIGDPHARIDEDALRILRFFRFHAQLGERALDAAGRAACRDRADALAGLSGERIRDELFKLLGAAAPASTFAAMGEDGILSTTLPGVGDAASLAALVTLEGVADSADPLRRLAASMVAGADPASVSDRLRLSRRDAARLAAMAGRDRAVTPDLPAAAQREGLYRGGAVSWRDAVLLNWAVRTAAGDGFERRESEAWRALLDLPHNWPVPEFPLQGADVVAAGVPQGPEVGRLLDAVEQWWIDGGFEADRAACLAELARRVG